MLLPRPLLVLSSLVPLLLAPGAQAAPGLECRPQGPIFPRPNLLRSAIFKNASDTLKGLLDDAVSGVINAGWVVNSTTFSIALVSHDQQDGGIPLWEYHHLAANTFLGTKRADRNSQYQIGSISKAITDAVLVRSGVNLDDKITKYLPALGGSSDIAWDEITLRGLASHLAGIPPNFGYSEYFYLRPYFQFLGFPRINNSDYLNCDVFGLNVGCSRSQYVVGLRNAHPVAPPMQRPIYSNVAFTLVMYAVGIATGRNYPDLLYEYITGPLEMRNTYPSPGPFNSSVVPPVGNSWGAWFGDATPGGGLVSTLGDLTSFVHGILTYTIFETPAQVREWLQPRSFTGSQYSFFGMPWEIYRPPPTAIFGDTPEAHSISIYTKDGAAYGYRARISAIDEYGVGLVILAAGDSSAVTAINDAMLGTLIPAIDRASRQQVRDLGYVGSFVNACNGSVFNVTLSMDSDSLILQGLSRNGSDILRALHEIFSVTYGGLIPNYIPGPILRLYPAEVTTNAILRSSGTRVVREDWRFVWDITRELASQTDLPGRGISSYDCLAWEATDWIYYGSESVDRIVFVKDAGSGEVLGVDVPFLRSSASRTSGKCEGMVYL